MLGLTLATLGVGGCSKDHHIEIQSDTCWDGQVNEQRGISGCQNKRYRIIGELGCVRVQKQSANGYVRLRLDDGPWNETSEPFGLVQSCQ